jgi:hypothetical protein
MKRHFFLTFSVLSFVAGLYFRPEPKTLPLARVREVTSHTKALMPPTVVPAPAVATFPSPQNNLQGTNVPAIPEIQIANAFIETHREEWKLQPHHSLRPEIVKTPLGSTVKYSFYENGYWLMGMDLEVHVAPSGKVTATRNNYQPLPRADFSRGVLPVTELPLPGDFELITEAGAGATTALLFSRPSETLHAPEPAYSLTVKDPSSGHIVHGIFRASDGQLLALSKARAEF